MSGWWTFSCLDDSQNTTLEVFAPNLDADARFVVAFRPRV
jgi:hypothetical protein